MIQAITDIPCIMFVDELVAAYPNAKVVLTNRDPDKWLVSILNTIYVILSWDWERWAIPYIVVSKATYASSTFDLHQSSPHGKMTEASFSRATQVPIGR